MSCRYEADTNRYMRGEVECTHDDYGDPVKHCTCRRRCNAHVGLEDQTCAACVDKARQRLRDIAAMRTLVPSAAVEAGKVNTELMNLAGATANPLAFTARRVRRAQEQEDWAVIGDPEPDSVDFWLKQQQDLFAPWFGHDLPPVITPETALKYLDEKLAFLAQKPEADFSQLFKEIGDHRKHLARQLQMKKVVTRGAPCPGCVNRGVYTRLRHRDGLPGWWECVVTHEHFLTEADYEEMMEAREAGANRRDAVG